MTPALAAAWLIITVGPNGEIHHDQFPTERQCLEAKSIAQTGKTLEAIEEEEAWRASYEKDHPLGVCGSGSIGANCWTSGWATHATSTRAECTEVKP